MAGVRSWRGFDYRLAQELREALARRGVRYPFLGKSGAILLGFPDTTQDVDLFPERSEENGRALKDALQDLGFTLSEQTAQEIVHGKALVQLKEGPFDVDVVFARTGLRVLPRPGHGTSTSRAFPSVISMTSSR